MTGDEARAVLIVAALLAVGSASVGGVVGRVTAPVPPAEVRYVTVEVPAPVAPPPPEDPTSAAPAILPPQEPAPVAPVEPPAVTDAPVDVKPVAPPAKPKVDAKPKPQSKPERAIVRKPRPAAPRQRKPTPEECAQMRSAGSTVVKAGGRLRGYSDEQIDRALRDCGI